MISNVLNQNQINRIHETSLDILSRVGTHIPHEEMLSRFADAGAEVDHVKQIVRIPSELVMDSISKAGKQFTIYGRDTAQKARFGIGERNYNGTAGQASW